MPSHLDAGRAKAFRFRARASGIAGVVHVYIDSRNTARALIVGVYRNAGRHPGALLIDGSQFSLRARAWNTVSVTPAYLSSGTTYWLAVLSEDGTLRYRSRRRGSCPNTPSIPIHPHKMPMRWSGGSVQSRAHCPISAYVSPAPATSPSISAPTGPTGVTGSTGSTGSTGTTGGTPKNCFPNPEGCGYPGPNDAGVANCSELETSGSKTVTRAETIENLDITGVVSIDASGVTMNHDCVQVNGREAGGSAAVILENGATNFTISNSTVRGNNTTSESIEEALRNNYSNSEASANNVKLENCAECLHQPWVLTNSYVISNGREKADENGAAHAEDWWFDNNSIIAEHDTLLNPSKQTAVIFAESTGGLCAEKVTNSLLAGGGHTLEICDVESGVEIKNDRFARKICTKAQILDVQGRGGYECSGAPSENVNYFDAGEGTGAYYPRGGFFGVVAGGKNVHWEGNYWDDNLEPQP
jgi:hypothetical protein